MQADFSTREVFVTTSFTEPAPSAVSQAGLVNNLNDGLAWGILPILFAAHGLSVSRIGLLVALYPAVWGVGQLLTGALSDRWGRKGLIAAGVWTPGRGHRPHRRHPTASRCGPRGAAARAGTAMVYSTVLAAVGDVADPAWRTRSLGVYRLGRDSGFAVGALLAGVIAAAFGWWSRYGPSPCSPRCPVSSSPRVCTKPTHEASMPRST